MIKLEHGQSFIHRLLIKHDPFGKDRGFVTDPLFPQEIRGKIDLWGIDEGCAALLKGFILALRPLTVLETGTHKGRSTRAICEGLCENGKGHLWTVDTDDYGLMASGAIRKQEIPFVTQVIGKTPGIFVDNAELKNLHDIDFAFLDGDHTKHGLLSEIRYVFERTSSCVILVDNADDKGWPEIKDLFQEDNGWPTVCLPTMCGMQIIRIWKDDS